MPTRPKSNSVAPVRVSAESSRTTPTFVPKRFTKKSVKRSLVPNGSPATNGFKHREITLDPVTVIHDIGPTLAGSSRAIHRKSILVPASEIPVCVEVHPPPDNSSEPKMTVYSIFGKRPTADKSRANLANGHVSTGNASSRELETIVEENGSRHVKITVEEIELPPTPSAAIVPSKDSSIADNYRTDSTLDTEPSDAERTVHNGQRNKRRRSSLLSLTESFFKVRVTEKASQGRPYSHSSHAHLPHGSSHSRCSLASSRMSYCSEMGDLRVTNFNRMTDLRKMLKEEEEKQDILKMFCDSFTRCECFEWNLNNAAILITVGVFILTIIMIINALSNL
ncbi:hypothetical protein HDE_08602 [Halotydeus destructor]|nr:hypothetical protein HDE_08602 [Halotydeus destructor]